MRLYSHSELAAFIASVAGGPKLRIPRAYTFVTFARTARAAPWMPVVIRRAREEPKNVLAARAATENELVRVYAKLDGDTVSLEPGDMGDDVSSKYSYEAPNDHGVAAQSYCRGDGSDAEDDFVPEGEADWYDHVDKYLVTLLPDDVWAKHFPEVLGPLVFALQRPMGAVTVTDRAAVRVVCCRAHVQKIFSHAIREYSELFRAVCEKEKRDSSIDIEICFSSKPVERHARLDLNRKSRGIFWDAWECWEVYPMEQLARVPGFYLTAFEGPAPALARKTRKRARE